MPRSTARSTDSTDSAATDSAPTADVAGADVDDNGQVNPEGPQAVGIVRTRSYASGEGLEAGNAAPRDLWLDTESDKVVTKQPERGVLLAQKGQPVEPMAARAFADHNYKG
jgi:hypothetical protein